MKSGTLEVFKIFSSILDEKQAEKVVEYIKDIRETEVVSYVESRTNRLANKEDLINTKSDIKIEIAQTKNDLEVKIAQTKNDLEVKIAQTKADLIKWMFIFWITQTLTILGVIAYLIKN